MAGDEIISLQNEKYIFTGRGNIHLCCPWILLFLKCDSVLHRSRDSDRSYEGSRIIRDAERAGRRLSVSFVRALSSSLCEGELLTHPRPQAYSYRVGGVNAPGEYGS